MDYEMVVHLSQTSGLLYFIAIFVGVLVYALRPKARATFDDAARIPFKED